MCAFNRWNSGVCISISKNHTSVCKSAQGFAKKAPSNECIWKVCVAFTRQRKKINTYICLPHLILAYAILQNLLFIKTNFSVEAGKTQWLWLPQRVEATVLNARPFKAIEKVLCVRLRMSIKCVFGSKNPIVHIQKNCLHYSNETHRRCIYIFPSSIFLAMPVNGKQLPFLNRNCGSIHFLICNCGHNWLLLFFHSFSFIRLRFFSFFSRLFKRGLTFVSR